MQKSVAKKRLKKIENKIPFLLLSLKIYALFPPQKNQKSIEKKGLKKKFEN
jgi:hypothetical protein